MDPAHLHTTPSTVLDGQNTTKHVCVVPRCVGSYSANHTADSRPTLVNLAVSLLIPNSTARGFSTQSRLLAAISLLVFTAVVFRSEVALLLAPVALHAMLFVVPPFRVIKTGILSAAVSIGKEGSRLEKLDAT